jgi:hypothetical protein
VQPALARRLLAIIKEIKAQVLMRWRETARLEGAVLSAIQLVSKEGYCIVFLSLDCSYWAVRVIAPTTLQ